MTFFRLVRACNARRNPLPRPHDNKTTGTLLPGETSTTSFSFKSADPGVFSDRWRLETAPPAAFVFSMPPPSDAEAPAATGKPAYDLDRPMLGAKSKSKSSTTADGKSGGGGEDGALDRAQGGASVVAGRRSNEDDGRGGGRGGAVGGGRAVPGKAGGSAPNGGGRGWVEVGLRGVALAPDTRGHARKRLADGVMRGILAAKVEEIVREVVRGVRTPVREEEVRARALFSPLIGWSDRHLFTGRGLPAAPAPASRVPRPSLLWIGEKLRPAENVFAAQRVFWV